jgi:hypothetical protein
MGLAVRIGYLLSFRGNFFCSDAKILLAFTARYQLLLSIRDGHYHCIVDHHKAFTMPGNDVLRSLRLLSRSSGGLMSGPKQVTVSTLHEFCSVSILEHSG